MLEIVLKHCLFHLVDGISQRENSIRLSFEHQNFLFLCVHFIIIIYYMIS